MTTPNFPNIRDMIRSGGQEISVDRQSIGLPSTDYNPFPIGIIGEREEENNESKNPGSGVL